jgi:Zn-dependent metalloprotease
MRTITHHVCGAIPLHILSHMAASAEDAGEDARTTLEQMHELAAGRTRLQVQTAVARKPQPKKSRHVYDARHSNRLPGKLVASERKAQSTDVEAVEAYEGSGATFDFYSQVFGRTSIDGEGLRLDSTVHYGTRFENALWNGRQMVYGDGDGRLFNRFTASLDVIGHELTHGVTQYTAALGYSGQNGALNEHISDAFGIMVKQYKLGQSAKESDWRIGAELFGPAVHGKAVRSMAAPGTAYDDPVIGRDPQPAHMRDYVHTAEDNGGVHINSGILNHGFYLAAIALDGYTWEVLGRIWYVTQTERLAPDAEFGDFTRATVDVAGELYGNGGRIQRAVADAWWQVGIRVPLHHTPLHRAPLDRAPRIPIQRRPAPVAALRPVPKWRHRPSR